MKKIREMKRAVKIIAIIIISISITAIGAYVWHTSQMNALRQSLLDEVHDEQKQNTLLAQQLASSKEEEQSLRAQVDELLTEEVAVFDAALIKEEIVEIGELGTVEYHYTNIGTVDSVNHFKNTEVKIPFSSKIAIVSMDGIIKAGVNAELIEIVTNEITKTITITIPEATIHSNEPDEESMIVYTEEEGLFNNLTLADGSSIRIEIKNKAEQNALENGILEQARENAGEFVKCLIEAIPSIKDTYTIEIRYEN